MTDTRGQIVTFYSFKGGVGRTFLLANLGATLASWGKRVLLVDWDLEAPGLHAYFPAIKPETGLLQLIQTWNGSRQLPWRDHTMQVAIGAEHQLDLLAAGHRGHAYAKGVQDLDWEVMYREGLGDALEVLRSEWRKAYDLILIDSRTGYADTSGICTIQLPDILVACATATEQSLEGLRQVIDLIHLQRSDLVYDRTRLMVVPVLNRFDGATELKLGKEWSDRFASAFALDLAAWMHRDLKADELVPLLRVPQIPYWNFGERLAVLEQPGKDPTSISWSCFNLAALLEHRLGEVEKLARNRDVYVRESSLREEGFALDVLVVSLDGGRPLAQWAVWALRQMDFRAELVEEAPGEHTARAKHLLISTGPEGSVDVDLALSAVRSFWGSMTSPSDRRIVVMGGGIPGAPAAMRGLPQVQPGGRQPLVQCLGLPGRHQPSSTASFKCEVVDVRPQDRSMAQGATLEVILRRGPSSRNPWSITFTGLPHRGTSSVQTLQWDRQPHLLVLTADNNQRITHQRITLRIAPEDLLQLAYDLFERSAVSLPHWLPE